MKFVLLLFLVGLITPVFAQDYPLNDVTTQLTNQIEQTNVLKLHTEISTMSERLDKIEKENQELKNTINDLGILSFIQSQQENTFNFFELYVGIIVAFSGMGVGYATVMYQKKQLQTTTLFKVFDLINSEEQREFRKKIFYLHCKLHPNGTIKDGEPKLIITSDVPFKKIIHNVRISYGHVNILIEKKLLDEKVFCEIYAKMVIRIWQVLYDDIIEERTTTKNDGIAKEFEKLKDKAEKYLDGEIITPYCLHHSELDKDMELQDTLAGVKQNNHD